MFFLIKIFIRCFLNQKYNIVINKKYIRQILFFNNYKVFLKERKRKIDQRYFLNNRWIYSNEYVYKKLIIYITYL